MGVRVPHRLGLAALVPLALRAPPGGDGVNDLPVGGGVPGPVGVGLPGRPGPGWCGPQAMNRGLASSRAVRLAAESMPAPGDLHELGGVVGGLEGLRDGDDRGGLGLVALPAADLQGETGPVDQQAHDDLGVDPPLLGVTDLAQVVLTLGLEVEGGHTCRHRARPPLAVTCSNRAPDRLSR